jgi:4-aminobutyrate aminotransferase/(S)-3-amino-2-methylpropionate transaminase
MQLKYPLKDNAAANAAEVERCLKAVDTIITEAHKSRPVAAVVVEPVQGEGGDRHAPPEFFKGLRAITRKVILARKI